MNSTAAFRGQQPPGLDIRDTYIHHTPPAVQTACRRGARPRSGAIVTTVIAVVLLSFRVSAADAQRSAEVLRYTLTCTINEDHASIDGEAEIWIRILRDSLPSVTWRFPAAASIASIRDAADNKIRRTVGASTRGEGYYDVDCPVPHDLTVNDSVFFRIRYTLTADTTATADVFIGPREFLLLTGPRSAWVPMLATPSDAAATPHPPAVLDVLAPSDFRILSGGTIDSLSAADGNTHWRITRTDAANWDESFCVAGSKDVRPLHASGKEGWGGPALYTSPAEVDSRLAESIADMLCAATRFFHGLGYRPRVDGLRFACIGRKSVDTQPVRSGNLILLRNSPAYAVYDSSVFAGAIDNVWLLETARAFAFDVPDSSYWFNESWAGYLGTRFLFAWTDTTEVQQTRERSRLLAHALDFFPSSPIAAGRQPRMNEDAVFRYKGQYVFLMLEYILGKEALDGVMRGLAARGTPPGISAMRSACEAVYGSSLGWFFTQWLYRTGFPEFVLTSETAATSRGTYEVTVTVTQRGDIFSMPMNVWFENGGRTIVKRIFVKDEQQRFTYMLPMQPSRVELNPQFRVLRWMPQVRILAHARTSTSYRVFTHDTASSVREAHLTLQLDPMNNVGANGIALFSLGKAAGAGKDWARAEDYFLRASHEREPDGYPYIPLLSIVRRANIMDMHGDREHAVPEYRRALEEAQRAPARYWPVIIEASRYLDRPFVPREEAWYEYY